MNKKHGAVLEPRLKNIIWYQQKSVCLQTQLSAKINIKKCVSVYTYFSHICIGTKSKYLSMNKTDGIDILSCVCGEKEMVF